MKTKSFKLSKYKKAGRSTLWRVRGTLPGKQIEKPFSDLGKAKAWQDVQEIARTNSARQAKATFTRLTPEQAFDAEKALAILDGKATLAEVAESFLAHYVAPEKSLTICEGVKLYDKGRQLDVMRGQLSKAQFKCTRAKLVRFCNWTGSDLRLERITTQKVQEYLDGTWTSAKNSENIRGAISHFLKWALAGGHIKTDPTLGVKTLGKAIKRSLGIAETISPDQVKKLFEWLEANAPEIVPAFALMTFAGVRPCQKTGEIFKLSPELVNVETGILTITPEISKVRELRKFKMSPNLVAWLRAYPLDQFPIVCHNWGRLRDKVKRDFKLGQDVLRHTAITYWVRKNKSIYDAADQFGNSESIIRKHYKDNNRTDAEAEEFFEIYPKAAKGELLKFAAG